MAPLAPPLATPLTELNESKFNDIRLLCKSEQHFTVKQAHKLSSKVCWPASLLRQKVHLALRLCNYSPYAALKIQIIYTNILKTKLQICGHNKSIWKISA